MPGSAAPSSGVWGFFSGIYGSAKQTIYEAYSEVYQDISEQVSDIPQSELACQLSEQVEAIPKFRRNIVNKDDSRSILENGMVTVISDMVPVIVAQATLSAIESSLTSRVGNPYFLISAGSFLLRSAYTLRHLWQASARIAVLQSKQSSLYDEATKNSRNKVSSKVCEDCTTQRYIKGAVRAPITYSAQQAVIALLKKLAGGYLTIGGFDLIVDSYSAEVIGQLIASYRLGSDGLCDRHQHEYNKQYWERIFALGLPVVLIRKIIAGMIESVSGVSSDYYSPVLESFISMAMVALTYNMTLPDPVKQSDRYPTLASFVRQTASYTLDKVGPDVIEYGKKMFSQPGEPFDFEHAYKMFLTIYRDPKTQTLMVLLLPKSLRSPYDFVQDPAIKEYWPDLQNSITSTLGMVEKYQPVYSEGIGGYLPKKLKNAGIALFAGVPKGAIKVASNLLEDPEFLKFVGFLKYEVSNMEVEVNADGVMAKLREYYTLSSPADDELVESTADTPMSAPQHYQSKFDKYDGAKLSQILTLAEAGVKEYVRQRDHATYWSSEGKQRAEFYRKLLTSSDLSQVHKLVVCVAILSNKSGPTLRDKVAELIGPALPNSSQMTTAMSQAKALLKVVQNKMDCTKYSQTVRELVKVISTIHVHANAKLTDSDMRTKKDEIVKLLKKVDSQLAALKAQSQQTPAELAPESMPVGRLAF